MSLPLIIAVILIGLVLVVLEIVALPGAVAGICGAIFVAVGIWQAYASHSVAMGTTMLLASIAVGIALLVFFMKSKTWKRASLQEEISGRANETAVAVGAEGRTISRIAPAGKALIQGDTVEVHSVNEFLDPDTPIRVIAVEGYKITVERI